MIDGASRVVLMVKNLPANVGDLRDMGLIPESERFPGGGHGNPLQYSCLENLMDRGTLRATGHGESQGKGPLTQNNCFLKNVQSLLLCYFLCVPPSK